MYTQTEVALAVRFGALCSVILIAAGFLVLAGLATAGIGAAIEWLVN
jgi:hypothetical protein